MILLWFQLRVEYLQTIVFILLIAAARTVRLEMFLKKSMPSLYDPLGVYLPLVSQQTVQCLVLHLTNVQKSYNLLESIVNGFATAFGFAIAITIMAGIREKMEFNDLPAGIQRATPSVVVTAALVSIALLQDFPGII